MLISALYRKHTGGYRIFKGYISLVSYIRGLYEPLHRILELLSSPTLYLLYWYKGILEAYVSLASYIRAVVIANSS